MSVRLGEPGRSATTRTAPGSGPPFPYVTGVRAFRGLDGAPAALHLAVAELDSVQRELPWSGTRQTFGTSWHSAQEAEVCARGEAVERRCGDLAPPPGRLLYASHAQLRRRGVPALDPADLPLYTPRQYATAGFPFLPFTADSPVHWVEARSLTRDAPVHVPAFLVYSAWRQMPRPRPEPPHVFPPLGGTAAGAGAGQAVAGALAEIVERDAAALWWAAAQPLPSLPLPEDLRPLLAGARHEVDVRLLHVHSEFGLPVLAAGVRSRAEGWLTYGFSARSDPYEAAAKALAEAWSLQRTWRLLDRPDAARAAGGSRFLKPYRADRRYLDSYRTPTGEVGGFHDQLCGAQLYLDPRAAERVAPWAWDLPEGRWPAEPGPRGPEALIAAADAAGFEVIDVDLTSPEAAAAGLHVHRVIVPGTVQAAPAAYPMWGPPRVREAPVRLGWRETPLVEGELNGFPMPHC
ncbi:YcaO-like family protein [Streptomyces sp. NPDC050095]|uniref:YcaO-like family protein n=1 Tax=unclassified Streptomyces TaxID=2593676 RepID=UPI00344301FA